ncbi:MAG TPA: TonB-dependent receptor [Gammaproteobacteria bacterium]
MKNRFPLFLAMLPLLAAAPLTHAAEPLAPVVVSATRTAQSADEALAAVTVISRDDIERSQAQSLPDLLSGLAGIDITSNGGYGKTTSLYLRGTNPGHTLLLIDGVPIGSATLSTGASFQYLPLAEIDHIEIVRGPQSALYGSDAIGGIIQVFTRQGGEKTRFNASAGAGQMKSRAIDAGVSSNLGKLSYHVQASRFSSDYIDVLGSPADLDGYNNNAASFNAKYRVSNTAGVEANVLRAGGVNEYDNSYDPAAYESHFLQQVAGARVYLAPASWWQLSLRGGESRDFSTEYRNGTEGNHFNTRRLSQSLQNDITLSGSDLLTVGLDHQTDFVASSVDYSENSRANHGLFIQNQWQGGGHSLTLGARRENNQAFGLHSTGRIAWGYRFADNLRLMASYGTGFKAPSFNELYWPASPYYSGNPNLKPEESQGGELGIGQSEGGSHWSVHYFNNLITNMIVYDAALAASNNIASARIHGFELEGGMQSQEWRLNAAATLEDPRDADSGNDLPRRARQTVRFDLDRLGGRFTWGPSLMLVGARYDDKNNTTLLRDYTLVNLHAAYQLMPDFSLQAKVDNLFDESYTSVAGYNMPGRAGFVSLHYLTH